MIGVAIGRRKQDTLALTVLRVERRLGVVLALLLLGITGILVSVGVNPVMQYLTGPEIRVAAGVQGEACGSHLEWEMDSRQINAGSKVTIANDSTYWQIPVQIDRQQSDGSWNTVAESPKLLGGDEWTHTFWRSGTYRIVSTDETQRLAGLETIVSVE
jgi:plastocyanin